MNEQKLTRRQSAIIGAYTGITAGPFDAIHEYAEEVLKRPVFSHEFGFKFVADALREASRADFLDLCYPNPADDNV